MSLPSIPLPRDWRGSVRAGLLHAVALARLVLLEVLAGFEAGSNPRAALLARLHRAEQKCALLEEELRIKDARMAQLPARNRPHYPPPWRLRILTLKSAAGWSSAETARRFLLSRVTIAEWLGCLTEEGEAALVQLAEPVNRFPAFVATVVKALKSAAPWLGRNKLAALLTRAGLTLAPSTVRRMLRRGRGGAGRDGSEVRAGDVEPGEAEQATRPLRVVTAKRPHHVWHVDLTVVPSAAGFWVPWLPFSLPVVWPWCSWVCAVVDHFSRAVVGLAVFEKEPTSAQVCVALERAARKFRHKPKYIVSDQGTQFGAAYRAWCAKRGVCPRFGAIGQHGSIAVIERFFLSLKTECTRRMLVPLRPAALLKALLTYSRWYNTVRPHEALGGGTPQERLSGKRTARPMMEVRPRYPVTRRGPRHQRRKRVEGPLELHVTRVGPAQLPVIELRAA